MKKIWSTDKLHIKHSIQTQIVLILCLSILLTVFGFWFANVTFLESFYENSKVKAIGEAYRQVADVYDEIETNDDIYLNMERLSASQGMSLYVFDIYSNSNTFFMVSRYPKLSKLQIGLLSDRVASYLSDYYGIEVTGGLDESGSEGYTEPKKEEKEVIQSNEQYGIYKVRDNRIDSEYIELFGALDEDSMVYIRSNFENIQESAAISNRFLSYMGMISVAVSAVFMFILGRKITVPIVELSDIAEKMSELNFEVKYQGKTKNEIGILGNSMNALSSRLEKTISELKSANNELQQDIAKRTEIDEMRQEFLSNVSHELKTPIALIQGYAEGLRDNINEDQESREFYCDVIMDEASKMNQMVKKLLTLNQMEFGNNQIQFERFDLISLIRSILASADILFQQKEAKVIFEEQNPVYVWADEFMIEEVITNYVSNAVNHLDGEKRIEITLERIGSRIRVQVFNTGKPIPEEELDKVWIKFYKVDKARTREYGGSGIGLSIVKAIMNSLNQECGVYNKENGVAFWFEVDGQQGS